MKKVNGVETSETRNTKNVTSTKRTAIETSRSLNTEYKHEYEYIEWFVDGKKVCQEKKLIRIVDFRNLAEHNSNDPDKSNNS